jgi:Spy/CpxP family protein refolding chaperone
MVISSIAVALAGTAALAQDVRGNRAARRGATRQLRGRAANPNAFSDRRLERLQQTLNLTDAQMNGLRALQENRRRETESLQQEMRQKRQALRQLMQEANPNPNEVGNATLALRETRQRIREVNQRFLSGTKGLLTPDQLQRLPRRLQ